MFPWKIFSRFVALQMTLAILALAVLWYGARIFLERRMLEQSTQLLSGSLEWAIPALTGVADLAEHCGVLPEARFRLTVIDKTGMVLCDSQHDFKTMDNHLSRPEVQQALQEGKGTAVRESDTLNERMLYLAFWSGERIVRGALHLTNVDQILRSLDFSMAALLGFVLLGFLFFSILVGRHFVTPIGRISARLERLEKHIPSDEVPLTNDLFGEWGEIESTLLKVETSVGEQQKQLEVEKRLQQTLLSALTEGILAIDSRGKILFMNPAFEQLIAQNENVDSIWSFLRNFPEAIEAFLAVVREGQKRHVEVLTHLTGEKNEKMFFTLVVSPLKDSSEKIYGAVGVFHDISSLHLAEQIRVDFVANASHELKTPLTAIHGFAETVLEDLSSGRTPEIEHMQIIYRNSHRVKSLLNDLLDLSALESGYPLKKQNISTQEMTDRVCQSLKNQMLKKQQTIETNFEVDSVHADPAKVEQVLLNLVENAVKYGKTGARIAIKWSLCQTERIKLSVSDDGPGISSEHMPRLFERFYRADHSRSREMGGTGLGLAIVKHIMLRHGGTVEVKSEVGKGSEFLCYFATNAKPKTASDET